MCVDRRLIGVPRRVRAPWRLPLRELLVSRLWHNRFRIVPLLLPTAQLLRRSAAVTGRPRWPRRVANNRSGCFPRRAVPAVRGRSGRSRTAVRSRSCDTPRCGRTIGSERRTLRRIRAGCVLGGPHGARDPAARELHFGPGPGGPAGGCGGIDVAAIPGVSAAAAPKSSVWTRAGSSP